jgi:hypothetical protein
MKKDMKIQAILRRLAIVPAAVLLASCGESDNLSNSDVGTVTSCASIPGATCVKGRFIDDAAVNVNYECGLDGSGKVRSVTGSDGGFSCPNGSEVTFSLVNPDNTSIELVLGTIKVVKPASIYAESPTQKEPPPVYFYVTPRTLVANSSSAAPVNMARLLQTLSTDDVDPELPSYRVIISDAAKRKLTAEMVEEIKFTLPQETVDPTAPTDGTFDKAVQDFLQSFDPDLSLLAYDVAESRLRRGVYSTKAGLYESYDVTATAGNNASGGMRGVGGGNFVGALWNLVDRRGRMIGTGVYSYELPSDTLLFDAPQAMSLETAADVTTAEWPISGDLDGLTYRLVNDSGVATGRSAVITNGVMTREAIAGSTPRYESLFGETPKSEDLGKWALTDGTGSLIPNGSITMVRSVPVAPALNPALWTEANIDFPLAVKVTLWNSDSSCTSFGCELGTFRMVVLSDGNIISDMSQKCGDNIDPATLTYPSGGTEIPLGVVANILDNLRDENNATMELMTLLVMIPNHSHFRAISPYLPYVQFGSGFGEDSLLRVGGANNLRSYGLCTAERKSANQCLTASAFAPDIAVWGNRFTAMKAFSDAGTQDDLDNLGGYISSVPTPDGECVLSPPAP